MTSDLIIILNVWESPGCQRDFWLDVDNYITSVIDVVNGEEDSSDMFVW